MAILPDLERARQQAEFLRAGHNELYHFFLKCCGDSERALLLATIWAQNGARIYGMKQDLWMNGVTIPPREPDQIIDIFFHRKKLGNC